MQIPNGRSQRLRSVERPVAAGKPLAFVSGRQQPIHNLLHDPMHFIVYDVTSGPEVDWIDDFIVAILFITIKIFRLTSMACRSVRSMQFDFVQE